MHWPVATQWGCVVEGALTTWQDACGGAAGQGAPACARAARCSKRASLESMHRALVRSPGERVTEKRRGSGFCSSCPEQQWAAPSEQRRHFVLACGCFRARQGGLGREPRGANMVRKVVRPYSAIMAGFEALDARDTSIRAYYEPMTKEVGRAGGSRGL